MFFIFAKFWAILKRKKGRFETKKKGRFETKFSKSIYKGQNMTFLLIFRFFNNVRTKKTQNFIKKIKSTSWR